MAYQVIARQYRPKTFDEVIGQHAAATILKNAIAADHVAHAYLFAGPRGVGKTTMARILAKALCCQKGPTPDPCNKCDACISIQNGDDLDAVEIDGASNNGVDQVRQLRENAAYVPARSRYKLYIIDEAHMLSQAAFNALLKTLEEPPPHVKFILVTTEPNKIPETVRSRCQRLDFRRIVTADMVDALKGICHKEKIKIEPAALEAIVRNSRGGLRDSESLLEQLRAFSQGTITQADVNAVLGAVSRDEVFALLDAIAAKDAARALANLDAAVAAGVDVGQYLAQLAEHVRSLMLVKLCNEDSPLIDETADALARLKKQAEAFETDTILYASQLVADTRVRVRNTPHSRVEAEVLLVKLCRLESLSPLGEVLERLEQLERRLGGAVPSVQPAPASQRVAPARGPQQRSMMQARTTEPEPYDVPVVSEGPVPEPSGAPAISNDPNDCWPGIVEALRKDTSAGGMLMQAQFLGAADGVIRLGFADDRGSKFARSTVEGKRQQIEERIHKLIGGQWRLHIEGTEPERPQPRPAPKTNEQPAPQGSTFVEQLVNMFAGTVTSSSAR